MDVSRYRREEMCGIGLMVVIEIDNKITILVHLIALGKHRTSILVGTYDGITEIPNDYFIVVTRCVGTLTNRELAGLADIVIGRRGRRHS